MVAEGSAVRLGLGPEEDGELRRLSFLAMFGRLSPEMEQRFLELRRRDRRGSVRDV
jgi:hypothetical protein